jgi:hypothetical protein
MKLWGCHSDMVPQLSTDTWYCEDPKFVDPDNGDYHLAYGQQPDLFGVHTNDERGA